MKKSRLLSTMLACIFLFILSSANAAIIASSTFDTDLDGWTSNAPSEVSWESSGGNPAGYASHVDIGSNGVFLSAPSKYIGDWSSFNEVGSVLFDHKLFDTGFIGNEGIAPYEVIISGPAGSALWQGSTPSGATGWVSLSAPIIESEWSVTGTWLGLLSNIDALQIRIEMVDNDGGQRDVTGLDNIQLSSVPIPPALWLFGSGLLGLVGMARRKKAA